MQKELEKYIEEAAELLGLNLKCTILGKGAIEYWAILSSSINGKIKDLQHERNELKEKLEKIEVKIGEITPYTEDNVTLLDNILEIINKSKGEN